MELFKKYLYEHRLSDSTVRGHVQNAGYFLQWITITGLYEVENITYNNLLSYVQYEQQRGLDTATINLRLSSINKYFSFLKAQGRVNKNPAMTLRIRGKAKTVIENPLKYDELESLYHSYRSLQKQSLHQIKTELAHQRNTIIVGLLVWQGLHSGELNKLAISHVNLDAGTIYIPSTARSNSRELKLSTPQILTMHTYLHGGTRAGLRPKADELLPGNLHNIVNVLTEELKGINPQIKNALHIRASVILHWLRQHNKRQVQYMAGHRHISSTEKYEVQELESLIGALAKHHPFE